MSKGMTALEIVFLLFIMIVVTLVIIRLVSQYVTVTPVLDPVKRLSDVEGYQQAYLLCRQLCDNYKQTCDEIAGKNFCEKKVEVDINWNSKKMERNVGNLVEGIPLCEDGIYCFHIYPDCRCGNYQLSAANCLTLLCNYYNQTLGYISKEDAIKMIRRDINPGTCSFVDKATGHNESYWWIASGYTEECP
jgi:hypothetical protein